MYPGQARQFIVHQGGHMELQHFGVLIQNVCCCPILLIASQLVVDLDDVSQFVGEIILQGARLQNGGLILMLTRSMYYPIQESNILNLICLG